MVNGITWNGLKLEFGKVYSNPFAKSFAPLHEVENPKGKKLRVFDFDDKIVILECDENQHRDRACSCEQTRMVNIGQAYGGIPVYFIRWNPDDYSPLNPRKVCEDIKKRYKLVGDYIKSILEKRIKLPVALVSAIYLYFDDWDGIDMQNWELITKYE